MRRPLADSRPLGPFAQGPFDVEDERNAVVEFTIDSDSIDIDSPLDTEFEEAMTIVNDIISPRFGSFNIDENRVGDFEVEVDVTDADLADVVWLEDQIDDAENRGVEIYDVKVDIA